MSFSILILTLNEEVNLPRCLDSVAQCDDIVILDSFSTDNTRQIAEDAGARVVQRTFDDFASQRNYALDEIDFKYPWVFQLDADEAFTPQIMQQCQAAVKEDAKSAYYVPSKLIFMERWLRWSGCYPVYQVRLVKRGEMRFVQNGHGQREGEAKRGLGKLTAPYLHYGFEKGLDDWLEKHERYAEQEATEALKESSDGSMRWRDLLAGNTVKRRRALKSLSRRLPFRPSLRFIYNYLGRGGFLDGSPGLKYCQLMSIYEKMIVRHTNKLKHQEVDA